MRIRQDIRTEVLVLQSPGLYKVDIIQIHQTLCVDVLHWRNEGLMYIKINSYGIKNRKIVCKISEKLDSLISIEQKVKP